MRSNTTEKTNKPIIIKKNGLKASSHIAVVNIDDRYKTNIQLNYTRLYIGN